ncbi:hypothetical protein LTR95_001666 [Oleoguttula sp. CCFEE 5521]
MSNYQGPQDNNPWSDPIQEPPRSAQQVNASTSNPYYQQGGASPNPWAGQNEHESSSNSYAPPAGPPPNHSQSNPFASESSHPQSYAQQQPQSQYSQQPQSYQPPSQQPGFGAPPRASTFNDTDFIPPAERTEQREAMENFEMQNSKGPSLDDRNVETLQREFPALDGALVAAIYGDSRDLGASREMLGELSRG